MELHDTEMIQKRLWELEKYYMILGWKRIHRFLRIFMEFCVCKVQLAPSHGNFISGVAKPEIVYMLPRFQILCIDWFFFFLKPWLWQKICWILMKLTWVHSNQLKVFWKMNALISYFFGGRCGFTNLNFICTRLLLLHSTANICRNTNF